jgi:hypothetical protein
VPLLSFSVKYDKLNDGTKTQTIRFPRKKGEIKVGDKLYIWWKSRTPEREKLGEGICTKIVSKSACDLTEEDAVKDGFYDLDGLRWALLDLHPKISMGTMVNVITWQWTYKENHDWRPNQQPKKTVEQIKTTENAKQ